MRAYVRLCKRGGYTNIPPDMLLIPTAVPVATTPIMLAVASCTTAVDSAVIMVTVNLTQ